MFHQQRNHFLRNAFSSTASHHRRSFVVTFVIHFVYFFYSFLVLPALRFPIRAEMVARAGWLGLWSADRSQHRRCAAGPFTRCRALRWAAAPALCRDYIDAAVGLLCRRWRRWGSLNLCADDARLRSCLGSDKSVGRCCCSGTLAWPAALPRWQCSHIGTAVGLLVLTVGGVRVGPGAGGVVADWSFAGGSLLVGAIGHGL